MAYVRARSRAFSMNNIRGSWDEAGLEPFQPRKVIHRALPKTPSSPPMSSTDIDPFDIILLTSSPPDVTVRQTANSMLKTMMKSQTPLNPSACNYVVRVVDRNERLEIRVAILEQEKTALQEVVSARKRQKSGKRGVLSGHHLVTRPELLEQLREKERKTLENKNKNKKKKSTQSSELLQISIIGEEEGICIE